MEKSLVKKAYKSAENDLQDKQIEEVKKIVLKTLGKIKGLKDERGKAKDKVKDLDEKIKILKMDIEDLKEGRLDRISERQEKDEEAKATSVVIIIKEKEVVREYPYWQWPYIITWKEVPIKPPDIWYSSDYNTTTTSDSSSIGYTNAGNIGMSINCSTAKWATKGTYEVGDEIINLR